MEVAYRINCLMPPVNEHLAPNLPQESVQDGILGLSDQSHGHGHVLPSLAATADAAATAANSL